MLAMHRAGRWPLRGKISEVVLFCAIISTVVIERQETDAEQFHWPVLAICTHGMHRLWFLAVSSYFHFASMQCRTVGDCVFLKGNAATSRQRAVPHDTTPGPAKVLELLRQLKFKRGSAMHPAESTDVNSKL